MSLSFITRTIVTDAGSVALDLEIDQETVLSVFGEGDAADFSPLSPGQSALTALPGPAQASSVAGTATGFDFTITLIDESGNVTQVDQDIIEDVLIAALERWGEFINGMGSLEIELTIASPEDPEDSFVASAGPASFAVPDFDDFEDLNGNGTFDDGDLLTLQVGTIFELATGNDVNGADPDIFVTINADVLEDGDFFIDSTITPGEEVPEGQFDLYSVLLHELGHGLGFIAIRDSIDDEFSTFTLSDGTEFLGLTAFDAFTVAGDGETVLFNGPATVAAYGEAVQLESFTGDPGSDLSHFVGSQTGTDTDLALLNPFVIPGDRVDIGALELALLADLGLPVEVPDDLSLVNEFDALDPSQLPIFSAGNVTAQIGDDGLELTVTASQEAPFITIASSVALEVVGAGGAQSQRVLIFGDDVVSNTVSIGFDILLPGGDTGFVGQQALTVDIRLFNPAQAVLANSTNEDATVIDTGLLFIGDTEAGNNVNGTASADAIFARGGDDVVIAGFGDDRVDGGDGDDTLNGQVGDDTLIGGLGNDFLIGAGGDDQIEGGAGDDRVSGGDGVDSITGASGNDILNGGEGDDTINGQVGDDLLRGDGGNDTLLGANGNDQIEGGAGNDTALGGNGIDEIFGEDGNDTLDGGGENDLLDGGTGNDTLSGDDGDDTLIGGAGVDRLLGEEGNDNIDGGTERDVIFGGDGNDIINGEEGDDSVSGDAGNDELRGEAGSDVLNGGDGDDTLFGGDGTDTLVGGNDADTLFGEADNDTLNGQAGDDDLNGGFGRDVLIGAAGNDTLNGDEDGDTLNGGAGNDILSGGTGNDVLIGATGNDVINGGLDNDNISGGAGFDTVSGEAGNDVLRGNAGNDVLAGGVGNDALFGGTGADVFSFGIGFGSDTVRDFEDGSDIFQIDTALAADFSALTIRQVGTDTIVFANGDTSNFFRIFNTDATVLDASDFDFVSLGEGASSAAFADDGGFEFVPISQEGPDPGAVPRPEPILLAEDFQTELPAAQAVRSELGDPFANDYFDDLGFVLNSGEYTYSFL